MSFVLFVSMLFLILGLIGGIIAVSFALFVWNQTRKIPLGTAKMKEIYNYIRIGAKAYMRRQFKTIGVIAAAITVLILGLGWMVGLSPFVAVAYVIGTVTSMFAAFFGMDVATRTNARVTHSAHKDLRSAFTTAFKGGTIMGLIVFGVNVIQIFITFIIFSGVFSVFALPPQTYYIEVFKVIAGCAFGSSFASVIIQLGGGIFTKGADIGADIVGKVEKDIPEDDPRNPAVIADAVGDNVGDCAGRSADLYETLSSELVASMILSSSLFFIGIDKFPIYIIFFPFVIRFGATIATIVGYFIVVNSKESKNTWGVLNRGLYISSLLTSVFYIVILIFLFQSPFLLVAGILGIVANLIIGYAVNHYTARDGSVTRDIVEQAKTGTATNIIAGLSKGFEAPFVPLLLIVVFISSSYVCGMAFGAQYGIPWAFGGVYGIVMMSMGMTSGTGIILSMDGFGPISDNAGSVAEMSGVPDEVEERVDALDATGNSTKSFTKGFSIISGMTIGFVTINAYLELLRESNLPITMGLDLGVPTIAVGGILAVILVLLFVSLLLKSAGKTANIIIEEVRRQFREKPGIMKGTELPDYGKCVDIASVSSLKAMILPGIMIVLMPILVGIIFGPYTAGAFLIIATFVAGGMGVFLNVGGAAFDNAKKYVASIGQKGTELHKSTIIGDTVGDPMKDTAGAALSTFVTTINNMALTFFPVFLPLFIIVTSIFI